MTKTKWTNAAIIIGIMLLLVLPAYAAQITVTGIIPGNGYNNGTISVTNLSGVNFNATSNPYLEKDGIKKFPYGTVYLISTQQLACSFDLTGLTAGLWNVTVYDTTNASNNFTYTYGFTVLNPPPVLSDANPKYGTNNNTALPITISGLNFLQNARVNITNSSATPTLFNADNVVVNGAGTQITCTLNLTNKIGLWQISVNNTDGQITSSTIPFTIYNPAPSITNIYPSNSTNDQSNLGVIIYGSGFQSTNTVLFTKNGVTMIPISAGPNWQNQGQINLGLNLLNIPVGLYNVTVTNPGALYNNTTALNAFQVFYPSSPVVSNINPTSGPNNGDLNVTITGNNFQPGAIVLLNKTGQIDIIATVVNVTGLTSITAKLPLNGTPVLNNWNVIVMNNDTLSNIPNIQFNITRPKPQVYTIMPNTSSNSGSDVTVQITGAGFFSPPQPNVILSKGSEVITGTSVVTADGTNIGCIFNLSGHTAQTYNVTVTNMVDGQSSDPLVDGFIITQPAPTVTKIIPGSGINNGPVSVNISGTGFKQGVIASLTLESNRILNLSSPAPVITPDGTQITCTFNLNGAPTGNWTVNVTNTDQQSGHKTAAFIITNPSPVVTGINPSNGMNDNNALGIYNLSGSNFKFGAIVTFSKNGELSRNATSVVNVSMSKITCFIDLTNAVVGFWNVTVTNSDGLSSNPLVNQFYVFYPDVPANIALNPINGVNTTPINTTITGTGFHPGLTANLTMGSNNIPGIVSNVTGTRFDSTFNLTGQTAGIYNLIVKNNDNQPQTGSPVTFTVTGAPLVKPLPNGLMPTSPNHDGMYKDLNGNGHIDFNDVQLYFQYFEWIKDNEPVVAFDFNKNGRIDFNDVVTLFQEL